MVSKQWRGSLEAYQYRPYLCLWAWVVRPVETTGGIWFISWIKELIAIVTRRIAGFKEPAIYETNALSARG